MMYVDPGRTVVLFDVYMLKISFTQDNISLIIIIMFYCKERKRILKHMMLKPYPHVPLGRLVRQLVRPPYLPP